MSKIVMAPVLLALAALAACGGPRVEWVKEGADASQLRLDRDACGREAGGYRFLDDSRSPNVDADRRGSQSDVYRSCMESRGWHRQRIQDKSAQ